MRVYLSRWVCLDVESNFKRLDEEAAQAAHGGAELAVFPESFLSGYTRRLEPQRARSAFARLSQAFPGTTFIFGSISEERRNRMTVWREGKERASYDKVNLFEPNGEEKIWDPGDRFVAVRDGAWTLGLINCNDIRFPEQARALCLKAGSDALVAVAWWPWRRDHVWSTLLRARAIENGAFVMGCCVSASEYPGEQFAGAGNYVFDPHGEPIGTADDRFYDLPVGQTPPLLVDPRRKAKPIQVVEVF